MKMFAYVVTHDGGFSPNPFGGICTLACCKPRIRRKAERGDIVIGTGSARHKLAGRLIYAMQVDRVLPLEDYWEQYPARRPSTETPVRKLGDAIWYHDTKRKWQLAPGAIHGEDSRDRDTSGRNALISPDFYYFGRDAIEIPERFLDLIATGRGHKKTCDDSRILEFWGWIKANAPKTGRLGLPFMFDALLCGDSVCNGKTKQADEDDAAASPSSTH